MTVLLLDNVVRLYCRYMLFATFYCSPVSAVFPMVVEISRTSPDSGIIVDHMFQRLGCYYLIIIGAVVANWFVFHHGIDYVWAFRSVELLAARHRRLSTVAKLLAQVRCGVE